MREFLEHMGVCVTLLAAASSAQLMSATRNSTDSVSVVLSQPLVVSADSLPANIQALDDSISVMNAETNLGEDAKNLAIYKGLELIGKSIKATASPNSAETESIEREWQHR